MGGGDIEAVQGVGGGVRVEVGRDGVGQGREGAGAVPGINQSQGKVDEAGEVWRGVLGGSAGPLMEYTTNHRSEDDRGSLCS